MTIFNATCAIVILYQPETIDNLLEISNQFKCCIVVDNSKMPNQALIAELNVQNIVYIPLGDNLGIATAQNVGIKKAKELDCELLVFFDQDSVIYSGFADRLVSSYETLVSEGVNVGLVGPRAHNLETGYKYEPRSLFRSDEKRDRFTSVADTLSSGSLIPMSVLDEVGDMMDGLFIDSVDHEWCWRAKYKFGKEIVIDEETLLPHMIGQGEIKFFGVTFNMGSSFRYYYVYRNWLLLMRFNYVPVRIKMRILLLMPIRLAVYFIVSKDRYYLTKMSLKGLYDGLIRKDGRFN